MPIWTCSCRSGRYVFITIDGLLLADNCGLQKDCIEFEEKASKDAKGKKVKRKQAVLRTRKSIGQGNASDSDDEFKPIKAAALKRKAIDAPKKAAPAPAKEKAKDVDEDVKPIVKRKAAAAPKKVIELDDSDGEAAYEMVAKREDAPPKRRAAAAAVKKTFIESDEDEDEEEDEPAPVKTKPASKAAGKEKAAPKARRRPPRRKRLLLNRTLKSRSWKSLLRRSGRRQRR